MVNPEQILDILHRKHVILCGGSPKKRRELVAQVLNSVPVQNTEIYRIPPFIQNGMEFLHTVKDLFPLSSPESGTVERMTPEQVYDIFLDWLDEKNKSVYIIWEEIGDFQPKTELYEFISDFVTQKYILEEFQGRKNFRLLATSQSSLDRFFRHAEIYFSRDEQTTDEEITRNHLEILELKNKLEI